MSLTPCSTMTYRAIYAYAWDIAELGVAEFVAEMRALGLDTVTLAGATTPAKFIRPQGKAGKVYFPEDGTVYFRADPRATARSSRSRTACSPSATCSRELCRERSIAVNAWMVLLHNTPARHASSARDRRERLRRPLRLQPLPVRTGGARICGRALQGRDRKLSGRRASRSRRRASFPMRTAFTTNSR